MPYLDDGVVEVIPKDFLAETIDEDAAAGRRQSVASPLTLRFRRDLPPVFYLHINAARHPMNFLSMFAKGFNQIISFKSISLKVVFAGFRTDSAFNTIFDCTGAPGRSGANVTRVHESLSEWENRGSRAAERCLCCFLNPEPDN